mgnify:CR=1 FL=1
MFVFAIHRDEKYLLVVCIHRLGKNRFDDFREELKDENKSILGVINFCY